jgi:hypothetical protein
VREVKVHGHTFNRNSLLLPAAVALIAVHGGALRYITLHAGLSATAATGIVALIVLKHLGLFGSLFGLFRRRPRA